MKKIGLYARVSTDEQASVEEGSLKNQIQILSRWVEAENYKANGLFGKIVDQYVDDGYSAKDFVRPQVQRLFTDIEQGRIDLILSVDISRMCRSGKYWGELQERLKTGKADFRAISQDFDLTSPSGELMVTMIVAMAQFERKETASRVKRSAYSRAQRGLWTGGPIPFGLKKTSRGGHLEIDQPRLLIVREIYSIFLNETGTLQATVDVINERGYLPDSGAKWNFQNLANWFRSYPLIGKIEVNLLKREQDQSQLKEEDRYQILKAVWPALVEEQIWLQAQELLQKNFQKRKTSQWVRHEFLLSGLLECPNGKRLTGSSGMGRSGNKFVQYRHGKADSGKCGCGIATLRAEDVEYAILSQLRKLTKDRSIVDALVVKANEDFNSQQPDFRALLAASSKKLKSISTRLAKAADMAIDELNEDDRTMWLEQARRFQREKKQAEGEFEEITKQRDTYHHEPLSADAIGNALEKFDANFKELPVTSKQQFINSIVEKIVVQRSKLILVIKNPGISIGNYGEEGETECYPGGRAQALSRKWLPETGDIRTWFNERSSY